MAINFEDRSTELWIGINRPDCIALEMNFYRDGNVRKTAEIEE